MAVPLEQRVLVSVADVDPATRLREAAPRAQAQLDVGDAVPRRRQRRPDPVLRGHGAVEAEAHVLAAVQAAPPRLLSYGFLGAPC